MSAQGATQVEEVTDDEMLDVETRAAILRWMVTALIPDGIRMDDWEHWIDGGCRGRLEAYSVHGTPSMLGSWARLGRLQ